MSNTLLDKVEYNKTETETSSNRPDIVKSNINTDTGIDVKQKLQAKELMEIFDKTNAAIEQINEFVKTFNNSGAVDSITNGQGIKWNSTESKFEPVDLQETPFNPSDVKVENSIGTKVGLEVMDGSTKDKTLVTQAESRKPFIKHVTKVYSSSGVQDVPTITGYEIMRIHAVFPYSPSGYASQAFYDASTNKWEVWYNGTKYGTYFITPGNKIHIELNPTYVSQITLILDYERI